MDDKELDSLLNEFSDKKEDTPDSEEAEIISPVSFDDSSADGIVESAEEKIEDTDEPPSDNEEIVIFEEEDEDNEPSEEADEEEPSDEELEEQRKQERLRIKEKRKNKKRKKSTHGRLAFALIMVTLVISVAVLGALGFIKVGSEILGLDRSDSEFSVEIPVNSGTEAIADILEQEGIIGNATLFRIVSKLKGADGTYIAGSHKLSPNMTYSDIIEVLQEEAINPREFVTITFPEGIRLTEAAKLLEEANVCGAQEFIREFNSATFGFDFEKKVLVSPKKLFKMEGYFFPDTYQFYLEEDPANVAKKVCKNFEYKITPDLYGRMDDMGMTLEETLTLASIVQREAGDTYNMKMVASVFHNRLNNPDEYPLLQSDPTSNYVKEVVIPNLEVYSESMCEAYDTYRGGGLPPGPICNPGIDAIEAVLYPRETNYYYFCSDLETGEFFYAETLEEHEANLVLANLV
ncbi:MAG: endolytic transglycosylase MltG [Oscillospiraceae bacterium]|nr:endolytic transglycosylase MltG [Oscillospiraceae bacterium]